MQFKLELTMMLQSSMLVTTLWRLSHGHTGAQYIQNAYEIFRHSSDLFIYIYIYNLETLTPNGFNHKLSHQKTLHSNSQIFIKI